MTRDTVDVEVWCSKPGCGSRAVRGKVIAHAISAHGYPIAWAVLDSRPCPHDEGGGRWVHSDSIYPVSAVDLLGELT